MSRAHPSITQVFYQEQASFSRFRRALKRSDQSGLDEPFTSARRHREGKWRFAPVIGRERRVLGFHDGE
jgi:hypothetical protein